MFTDVEIGLMMRHNREMGALTRDAQRLVDRKDSQIRNLQFALAASRAANAGLRADVGQSRLDDMLMIRALKARAAH